MGNLGSRTFSPAEIEALCPESVEGAELLLAVRCLGLCLLANYNKSLQTRFAAFEEKWVRALAVHEFKVISDKIALEEVGSRVVIPSQAVTGYIRNLDEDTLGNIPFVVFRGTKSLDDVMRDLRSFDVVPMRLRAKIPRKKRRDVFGSRKRRNNQVVGLTGGSFYERLEFFLKRGLLEEVVASMEKFRNGLILCGHGTGAAIAQLFLAELAFNYPNLITTYKERIRVVTFGEPRCFSLSLAKRMHKLPIKKLRFFNEEDIVTGLPSHTHKVYRHFGKCIYASKLSKQWRVANTFEDLASDWLESKCNAPSASAFAAKIASSRNSDISAPQKESERPSHTGSANNDNQHFFYAPLSQELDASPERERERDADSAEREETQGASLLSFLSRSLSWRWSVVPFSEANGSGRSDRNVNARTDSRLEQVPELSPLSLSPQSMSPLQRRNKKNYFNLKSNRSNRENDRGITLSNTESVLSFTAANNNNNSSSVNNSRSSLPSPMARSRSTAFFARLSSFNRDEESSNDPATDEMSREREDRSSCRRRFNSNDDDELRGSANSSVRKRASPSRRSSFFFFSYSPSGRVHVGDFFNSHAHAQSSIQDFASIKEDLRPHSLVNEYGYYAQLVKSPAYLETVQSLHEPRVKKLYSSLPWDREELAELDDGDGDVCEVDG